jgi:hypothetical protein
MPTAVEFENDRLKVLRVKHRKGEEQPPTPRKDRLVVYLGDARITRTVDGKTETIARKAGDVVWREHSHPRIANAGDGAYEVVIVEFK